MAYLLHLALRTELEFLERTCPHGWMRVWLKALLSHIRIVSDMSNSLLSMLELPLVQSSPFRVNVDPEIQRFGLMWKLYTRARKARQLPLALATSREEEGESSVNQSSVGQAAIPVPEEGARSPYVVPYSYHLDEVIGGDSVQSIQRRLLSANEFPSYFELTQARMEAEDLFEVKVDIVRRMAVLDLEGDWLRRGAWALENPRTATEEPSLERLHTLLSNLESRGVNSDSFKELKEKVFLRQVDDDEHSAA
ncbi:uncharacterized protein LOC129892845 [Solanum dulcamara]|uniref:uncharacterized protein LOC129892845 n=1 Tax=Solanum dulcamara TaxID=45834 RepID=UPI002485F6A5|nr:uncharacterized protein LOC129892845 [Solanum dulcamara]